MGQVDLADKLRDARARVDAEFPTEDREVPKFARLTRKDTRIRPDQDAALTALAKSLMRRRAVKTERITENTLIRIAIDLLLAHANDLRGSTEDELRNSATSGHPHFPTPVLPHSGASGVTHSASSERSNSGATQPFPFGAPSLGDGSTRTPGVSATPGLPHSGTAAAPKVGGSRGWAEQGVRR